MAHRDLELIELTREFARATLQLPNGRPARCSFYGAICGRPCEGKLQACHFLKRQRVRHALEALGFDRELIQLAEWDPRNGVPGCEMHHQRFDSQRMPPLAVPRHLVPVPVVDFTAAWGLETQLEDRCPEAA
jgi:hypothetical protein